jgi:ferredoxin-NADP reductase
MHSHPSLRAGCTRPDGRLRVAARCQVPIDADTMVFVCGPEPMIEAASEAAFEAQAAFHSEVFYF